MWTRALDVLPRENLTSAEQKQKDQYESELQAAKKKAQVLKDNPKKPEGAKTFRSSECEKLPWMRAMVILPGLAASLTWNSSVRRVYPFLPVDIFSIYFSGRMQAWAIERAYHSWTRGIKLMKECKPQQTPAGPGIFGCFGVGADLGASEHTGILTGLAR